MTYNTYIQGKEFNPEKLIFSPEWIDQKLEIPDIDSDLICTEIALDAILWSDPDVDVEKCIKHWESLKIKIEVKK